MQLPTLKMRGDELRLFLRDDLNVVSGKKIDGDDQVSRWTMHRLYRGSSQAVSYRGLPQWESAWWPNFDTGDRCADTIHPEFRN